MKTLSALAVALSLAACGQTGPLRLPDPKPGEPAPTTPPIVPPGGDVPDKPQTKTLP